MDERNAPSSFEFETFFLFGYQMKHFISCLIYYFFVSRSFNENEEVIPALS